MKPEEKNELIGLRINEAALEGSIEDHKARKDGVDRSATIEEEKARLSQIRARIGQLETVSKASRPAAKGKVPKVS